MDFSPPNPTPAGASAYAATNPILTLSPQQQQQQLLIQHYQQQQLGRQLHQQQAASANSIGTAMAMEDAAKVANPDIHRPFSSVEDAVNRLLPYHVVADYEEEEHDSAQWDKDILEHVAVATTNFEKQVRAFNIMSCRRTLGEFRAEEQFMVERALLHEERNAFLQVREERESREKVRHEVEARMRLSIAQAEAGAQALAQTEMTPRMPIRANAVESYGHHGSGGHVVGAEQWRDLVEITRAWRNSGSSSNNNNNNN